MTTTNWADEIRDILRAIERALRELTSDLWDNTTASDVWPRKLPGDAGSLLGTLHAELDQCRQSAHEAFDRYSSGPCANALTGRPLSREQYYLCRAMGADFGTAPEVGLAGLDDYGVYQMLCYEDDERWAYIDIHLAPRKPTRPGPSTRVSARFGRAPKECRRRYLRPEQHDFFREHLPDVYDRFLTD
jgi:hypothetical protein